MHLLHSTFEYPCLDYLYKPRRAQKRCLAPLLQCVKKTNREIVFKIIDIGSVTSSFNTPDISATYNDR